MPDKIPFWKPDDGADESKRERDEWYNKPRWKSLSKRYRLHHPLCAHCLEKGIVTSARVVHHKIDRLAAPHLAFTWHNLESLCISCHNIHTNKGRGK